MKRKILAITLSLLLVLSVTPVAANDGYAWLLVDTHIYPAETSNGAPYSNSFYMRDVKVENRLVEIRGTTQSGASSNQPHQNLHAKYTWSTLPTTINANGQVSLRMNQESISFVTGGFASSYETFVATGAAGQTSGSGQKTYAQFTAPNGNKYNRLSYGADSGISSIYNNSGNISVDYNFTFKGAGSQVGEKWSIYVCVHGWGGSPVGKRYTYEWKQVTAATPTPSPTPTTPSTGKQFTDLNSNHWGYDTIMEMVEMGILSGYPDGTFRPNNTVTRAEFASIMVRALDLHTVAPSTPTFADVPANHWAYGVVESAKEYLTGYRNTRTGQLTFELNSIAVREDVAVAIVKAQGLGNANANLGLLNQFSDQNQISSALRNHVAIAVEFGYMRGTNIGFEPQKALTRAEACALLSRIIKEADGKEKIAM